MRGCRPSISHCACRHPRKLAALPLDPTRRVMAKSKKTNCIPRTFEEAISLRDAELGADVDQSPPLSSGGKKKFIRMKRSPSNVEAPLFPSYPSRSHNHPKPSCCHRWCRIVLVVISIVALLYLMFMLLDEYYHIELCHTVTPGQGDERVCHLLAVKNNTLEGLDLLQRASEPYVHNATDYVEEVSTTLASSAWGALQSAMHATPPPHRR